MKTITVGGKGPEETPQERTARLIKFLDQTAPRALREGIGLGGVSGDVEHELESDYRNILRSHAPEAKPSALKVVGKGGERDVYSAGVREARRVVTLAQILTPVVPIDSIRDAAAGLEDLRELDLHGANPISREILKPSMESKEYNTTAEVYNILKDLGFIPSLDVGVIQEISDGATRYTYSEAEGKFVKSK